MFLYASIYKFFFIHEISVVPYKMLCMINSCLKQLENNDKLFGGISILVFDDLLQLPPVIGKQVFLQPEIMVLTTHLWQMFSLVRVG